jgi:hypothetical protein
MHQYKQQNLYLCLQVPRNDAAVNLVLLGLKETVHQIATCRSHQHSPNEDPENCEQTPILGLRREIPITDLGKHNKK